MQDILTLLISAFSQGLIYAPMALGVYIAFKVLKTPDLTIDGSFVVGMTVCAVVTIAGYPVLALFAAMAAGALAGLCTAVLQTKLRIEPILCGILVSTGLYTINMMVLGGQPNLYLQREVINASGFATNVSSATIYKTIQAMLRPLGGLFRDANTAVLLLTLIMVAVVTAILEVFFYTRPGMAIRGTGDNEEMVRSSSINADRTRSAGIMLSNALVAFSGALLCQQQRYADLNCGSGMLVMGLAAVIIGDVLFGKKGLVAGLISAVVGSMLYRLIIQLAFLVDIPSYAFKLLSTVIVIATLGIPLLRKKGLLKKGGSKG